MTDGTAGNPLLIGERVSFFLGEGPEVNLIVAVPAGHPRTTDGYPGVADRTLSRYEQIHRHRCANGRSLGVRHEFSRTEVAHLFEHITIEELALSGVARSVLSGETRWDFRVDGAGVYRVLIHGISLEPPVVDALRRAATATVELLDG